MEAPKYILGTCLVTHKIKGEIKMSTKLTTKHLAIGLGIFLVFSLLCNLVLGFRGPRIETVNVDVTREIPVTVVVTQEVTREVVITATPLPFTPTSTLAPTNTPTNTPLPTSTITPFPTIAQMMSPTFVVGTLELNNGHVQVWWDKVVVGEMHNGGIWLMDREAFYQGGLDMTGVKAVYILIQGQIRRFRFADGAWSFKPSPQGGIGYCVAADCSDQLTSNSAITTQQEILDLFLVLKAGGVRIGTEQYYNHVFWLRGNPAPVVVPTATLPG